MSASLRFPLSLLAGIVVAVATWRAVVPLHSSFTSVGPRGLLPVAIAGIVGGIILSIIAPRRQVVLSLCAGALLAAIPLAFIAQRGLTPRGQNPLFWYWPVWLIPAFAIGAFQFQALRGRPNKSLERTRDG